MRAASALRVAVGVVAGGGALLLAAFLAQRRLLYFPAREDAEAATGAARRLGLEPWPAGGVAFQGWRSPSPRGPAAAVALVLHGNAGSALDRTYLRDVLQGEAAPAPIDVVLLEYPGYGPRSGAPGQRALVRAARDAIERLRAGSPARVLLVGESLGSAVAALAAAERPDAVDALLLVTPFTRLADVARRHYPLVPGWLLRDPFRADESLPRHPGPVGFLVAGRDEIVFSDLGRALFDAYPGTKRLWVEEAAGHNAVPYDPRDRRWGERIAFLLGAAPARAP